MTVKELCEKIEAVPICIPSPDREIVGAYVGDLLSWVMGRAEADSVWVTIMSNINVVAVASLADVACVIMAEGVDPDTEALKKAEAEGINLLKSTLTSYELCVKLSELI